MPVFKLNDVFAGRYVLSELIGEGGFSEVWKAHDQMADDAVVAVKIYAPQKGLDDFGVRQFRKEFSLTHHLFHPHLLRVYHFDISEGSPYLIMPFCSYGSLNRMLEAESEFTEKQVALVFCQIGSALKELHSQNPPILHQDLKPDNILVMQPENFMLADFGISSQIQHTLQNTTSESKSITVAYAPPERFDRFLVSDASGDIFSLGVTIFELCTKTIPWDGSGGQSLLKGGHVPNLPERYSAELNKILQDCMSANRGKRPSAAELHLRGKNFLETGEWTLPKKRKNDRKSVMKKLIPYGIAAAVGLIIFGSYLSYQNKLFVLPEENDQKLATSLGEDPEMTEMVDQMMQEELKNLAKRTVELEEANKRLMQDDSAKANLLLNQERQLIEYKNQLVKKDVAKPSGKNEEKKATPIVRETKVNTIAKTVEAPKPTPGATVKNDNASISPKAFENHLNKISNPEIPREDRARWKQETMDQFSESSIRILDETEGTPKQYSAGIFLNLLYNVPHQIVVKEVKTDQNKKITELRLTMQSKM